MSTPFTGKNIPCRQCGKDFYVPLCRIVRGAAYCSRACMRIAQTGSLDPVEAFWLKVDKSAGPEGCWLYTGFRKWDGYGWLARTTNGKTRHLTAHRYAWELQHGPTNGLQVLHKCDTPPCCNPAHLFLGTHQDNHADKVAKGRHRGRNIPGEPLWPGRVRPRRAA